VSSVNDIIVITMLERAVEKLKPCHLKWKDSFVLYCTTVMLIHVKY